MPYVYLLVTAMAVFVSTAAAAFAWAASTGQFGSLDEAASSIFWDDELDLEPNND